MTDIAGIEWINLVSSRLMDTCNLIFAGVEQSDAAPLHIPFEPFDDLVQTVMDLLGVSGDLPYVVSAFFIALAAIFLFMAGLEFLQKGMGKIRNLLGESGRSGVYSEAQLRRDLKKAQGGSDWMAAAEASEQLGELAGAAKYYQMAGKHDKAGSLFESRGDYVRAAACYASLKQYEKATNLLIKGKDDPGAAVMAERAKNFARAAGLFEKTGKYDKSAEMLDLYFNSLSENAAPDTDLLQRSARIYEKAGNPEKAADCYRRSGALQKAGELYEKTGRKADAADLFFKCRDFEHAAGLFEELGDLKRSGEIRGMMHNMSGNYAGAAEEYLRAGDYFRAAENFLAGAQYEKAADTYLRAGSNTEAAEAYMRAEQWFKAAEIYERSENPEAAAEIYEKQFDLPKAIECYKSAKQHYKAGRILMSMDLFSEALELFDLVEREDPYYHLAQAATGICLFKMNDVHEAGQILEKALETLPLEAETKEAFYTLGLVYEKTGRRNEARRTYRKILTSDETYLDIKERFEKLSSSITDSADSSSDHTVRVTETPGKIEQRYEIIREIGRGGMGVVSQARDRLLERDVALKQLSPTVFGEKESHDWFLREARAASRLNHSNIVSVYDVIEDRNSLFIAMEYVDGISLHQYLEKNPSPPVKIVLSIAIQVAEALRSAHDHGVIHRDVKPDNILITKKGRVKITDFGIAHMTESNLTATGVVMGTMKYMSPEQIKGEKVSAASDLYSFGVVLYEVMTGAPPFVKGDMTYHQVHTPPVPPREIKPDMPESLEKIILKCLAKDAAQRYSSAAEIIADLKAIREGQSEEGPTPPSP